VEGARRGKRRLLAILAVVLLAFGLPGEERSSASTDAQGCQASQFSLYHGPDLSSPTGHLDVTVRLRNRGPTCRLRGYPDVALLDGRGRVLPFTIRTGGDQVVTSRPPTTVRVPRGGFAWIVLSKYRCDLGALRVARAILIRLPGVARAKRLNLPFRRWVGYCGKGDPGSIVTVSPVAPRLRAALQQYGPGG